MGGNEPWWHTLFSIRAVGNPRQGEIFSKKVLHLGKM